MVNNSIDKVVDLIHERTKKWKRELITRLFSTDEAATILCIPLSHSDGDNSLSWKVDNFGEALSRAITSF